MSQIRVTPSDCDAKIARLRSGDVLVFTPGVYERKKSLTITASKVTITGEPGAVLYSRMTGGEILVLRGSDCRVEKLAFESDKPYGDSRPRAIVVRGSRNVIRDCRFRKVDYCVLLDGGSKDCIVRDISLRPSGDKPVLDATYVCYFKGSGHTIENVHVDRSSYHTLRGNLYENVTIRNVYTYKGGIVLQKGDGAMVEDCTLDSAYLVIGPLNNKDGVRGDGGPKPFLAARTKTVTVRDVSFSGDGSQKLAVGNRCDGVRIDGITGKYRFIFDKATRVTYPAGKGYPAGSVLSPKAVNVWRDGKKIG